jgi:formate dehydrogenase subunit gamma
VSRDAQKVNIMIRILARTRHVLAPLVFLALLGVTLQAHAQRTDPNAPVEDPDAGAVKEQKLLQQESRIQGRIDLPDKRARVLIQPAGRVWDHFHEVTLHWLGAIIILGMIAILALGYWLFGKIRISSGRSGKKVKRFSAFERFSHWLNAVSFVVLALTGLNITFGKLLLLPLIGPEAFSAFAQGCKYAHNFVAFSFMVGLFLIVALWLKDNIPKRVDIDWVKQGGGFIKSKHAPAGRFNAGEKMVFWLSLGAGAAIALSGLLLLFPFYGTNIAAMQFAQVVHAIVAVLFIALILAHIYIGTIGMEGAFEAMGTGEVDLNWAKEHHDQWLPEALAKERSTEPPGHPTVASAK